LAYVALHWNPYADTSYPDLALRQLRVATVRPILIGGAPGTGKTTLAGKLADRLGAVLLSSVRRQLAAIVSSPTGAPC
jgi:hypothetical protein